MNIAPPSRKYTSLQVTKTRNDNSPPDGLQNAKDLLAEVKAGKKNIHFIEVMACPGGCIGGGGQPINTDEDALKARMKSIYSIDERESIKVSHKNPEIMDLYKDFLGEPLGEKSHHLLHTTYEKRDVLK